MKPRVSPKELMQHIKHTKIFDRVLEKVRILSLANGNGQAEFTIEEEHTNVMGQLHTGFATMVADLVSSYSFSTHDLGNNYHVSIDMKLSFYKTDTTIGDEIEVLAKTLRGGNSIAFLEVLLKNKTTGRLIATGNHDMFILHPHTSDHQSTPPLEEQGKLAKDGDK